MDESAIAEKRRLRELARKKWEIEEEEALGNFNADLFTSQEAWEEEVLQFKDTEVRLRFIHASNQHVDKFVSRVVWPAANELCTYFAQRPEIVRGKKVLELGSGTGLCGLVVALLGAKQVVLTDYNQPAIDLLQVNIDANDLVGRCHARKLTWGDRASAEEIIKSTGDGPFDLVIGTDVVYEPACVRPLLQSAMNLLSDDGVFYLANHTHRYGRLESDVVSTASELGFPLSNLPSLVGYDGKVDLATLRLK